MSDDTIPQVYFSYKWGGDGERIVDAIDAALKAARIPFVRDKADLGYKGRIGSFMQRVGSGGCVVVVICDQYLRSPNTMTELVEMARQPDVHDRIFPVVLADADIYDAARRIQYVKYWEDKKKELSDAMRSVDLANLQGITDDLNTYDSIRDHVSRMTSLLKDMNTLTPEMHRNANFVQLIASLRERLDRLVAEAEAGAGDAAGAGNADDDAQAEAEGEADDEPAHELPEDVRKVAAALAQDLQTVMDDPQAEGLMVYATSGDDAIDLAMIVSQDDGALECRLASNDQLPQDLRLPASARRELVTAYDFAAPDEPGGDYVFLTEPADEAVIADLAARLASALVELYGVPGEALAWRALPD